MPLRIGVVHRSNGILETRTPVAAITAVRVIAEDIKLAHSVFALPFAVLSAIHGGAVIPGNPPGKPRLLPRSA